MKYLYFVVVCILCSSLDSDGQNLIQNGSFEERDFGVSNNRPSRASQLKKCRHWKESQMPTPNTQSSWPWSHSPEWFMATDQHFHIGYLGGLSSGITGIDGNTGHGYAGMTGGELIAQKINGLSSQKSYTLSLFVRIIPESAVFINDPDNISASFYNWTYSPQTLNIYYSRNRLNYRSDDYSPENCADKSWHEKSDRRRNYIIASSIDIWEDIYDDNQWHQITVRLPNPPQGTDWLSFELMNCSGGILIDDVVLEESSTTCEECNTCGQTDGCIGVTINGNHHPDNIQWFGVHNLDNVSKLSINLTELDQPFQSSFRYIEITNPESVVRWDGKDNQGFEVPAGFYVYLVTVENDCDRKEYVGRLQKVNGSANPTTWFTGMSYQSTPKPKYCCGEDLYLENTVLTGTETFKADNIYVGPRVFIKQDADITFIASNSIELSPTFQVFYGGNFNAYIEECSEEFQDNTIVGMVQGNQGKDIDLMDTESLKTSLKTSLDFDVFPNPNNGQFNIRLKEEVSIDERYISIYDLYGRVVFEQTIIGNLLQVNLPHLSAGLYFVRVTQGEQVSTKKFIIK